MNEETQAAKTAIRQPPVLFSKTQAVIADATDELGGAFIAFWNSTRGSISQSDVNAFYEVLEHIGYSEQIFLFIKSDGGRGQASLRIINLLRQHCRRLIALVPLECASAATMLALGCDEIRMGPMAYLTAVDTSLTHDLSPLDRDNDRVSVSLDELKRSLRLMRDPDSDSRGNAYETLFKYVHPLVVGAVDRADSLSIMLCKELLSHHIGDLERVDQIANTLNSKYPSHSYPILFDEAQRIGLKAERLSPRVNQLLLDLNELYSEMGQRATTDFSDTRSHSNEILNIVETRNRQIYFQQDKDWFYRSEERRWITMNDQSSWRRIEKQPGRKRYKRTTLHIR